MLSSCLRTETATKEVEEIDIPERFPSIAETDVVNFFIDNRDSVTCARESVQFAVLGRFFKRSIECIRCAVRATYQPVVIEFVAATSFCSAPSGIAISFFRGATGDRAACFFRPLRHIIDLIKLQKLQNYLLIDITKIIT